LGLRRAKRRNMERLSKACGGIALNSLDEMTPDDLGYAGLVYEHVLGDNKLTFVEDCKNPKSVTLLLKGPQQHSITQMKDAIKDGLRSLFNVIQDGFVVPGAGAFELAVSKKLENFQVQDRSILGVKVFGNAILVIPKVLAANAGYDSQDVVLKALMQCQGDTIVGLDLETGDTLLPPLSGILDIYSAKRQMIDASVVVATNLLLTDEIMRAGLSSLKG